MAEAAIADGWGEPVIWLTAAIEYFSARADDRLASSCRSLLRRTGAPVPRRRSALADDAGLRSLGVTAREEEVLGLLGQGRTNKVIGELLFMSTRTVERHVASLTDKIGVTGRAELVAFAARRGEGLATTEPG